jgi:hypothetical protein
MQLELERIKTFKLQKTSPQKLAKGSIKVGAKIILMRLWIRFYFHYIL